MFVKFLIQFLVLLSEILEEKPTQLNWFLPLSRILASVKYCYLIYIMNFFWRDVKLAIFLSVLIFKFAICYLIFQMLRWFEHKHVKANGGSSLTFQEVELGSKLTKISISLVCLIRRLDEAVLDIIRSETQRSAVTVSVTR